MITGFTIGCAVFAVDGLCQDAGAGGFTHSPRTTKQEGMGQLVVIDGILQRGGDMGLPHHGGKILRTVFSR